MSLPKSFSLSFLDLMTCGFGGVIVVFLLLVTFLRSPTPTAAPLTETTNDAAVNGPLLIVVSGDEVTTEGQKSIWALDRVLNIDGPEGVRFGASADQLTVLADQGAGAEVWVNGLAVNANLTVTAYVNGEAMPWRGNIADWPEAGGEKGLQLWPSAAFLTSASEGR